MTIKDGWEVDGSMGQRRDEWTATAHDAGCGRAFVKEALDAIDRRDTEIAELHRVIDNLREGDELRGKLKAREMALVRDQLDAEIVRLSREKARLALENDRLASSLVEIQEAVADAHGQLTDDGLIDDDYDAIEGVRLLRVQRDNALEAEEMHGRHWDQECEENARLRARLLAEHGDCGSEECDVCALLDLVEVTS